VSAPERDDLPVLQTFVVELGAALSAAGEPVYSVQDRLSRVARAYGIRSARISAFPTSIVARTHHGPRPATERHPSRVVLLRVGPDRPRPRPAVTGRSITPVG
jgi:uncharacterized membrane protein YjjP (DUF1212 family)